MFEYVCVFSSHTHFCSFPSAKLELCVCVCVWLNLAGLICSLQTCLTDKKEEERKQGEEGRKRERDSERQKQQWKERTGV